MTDPTITLTARDLDDLVKPVIPLASRDQMTPILTNVRITTRGGYVLAAATDRFRAGIQRVKPDEAPDENFSALVPVTALKQMLSMWRPSRTSNPRLSLTLTDAGLRVIQADGFDFVDASITFATFSGDFPAVESLVTAATSDPDEASRIVLNASFIADFKHAVRDGSPMVIKVGRPGKPITVTIGDDFIGVLMRAKAPSAITDAVDHWAPFLDGQLAKKKASAA